MVPGKKIFKVFLPCISMAAILVMWHYVDEFSLPCSYILTLHSYIQAYIQNLAENGPVVTDKMSLGFICK